VRVGTLDEPDLFSPGIHIFTASKQPWLVLPASVTAFANYNDRKAVWPTESLNRAQALRPLVEAYNARCPQPRSRPCSLRWSCL
jgi:hypothetical protein